MRNGLSIASGWKKHGGGWGLIVCEMEVRSRLRMT